MKKEKRKSVILPKYNKEHPSKADIKTPWFMEFLPEDIISPENVTPKKNLELFNTFKRIEREVNERFEERVREEFEDYFVEALADEEILRCLPKKPVPVKWEDLTTEEKRDVVFIYKEAKSKGFVENTIRRHIRRYFEKKRK